MGIQRVSSKWTKTVVLQRSRSVNGYIPVTRKYSRQTLERMTELFESNYIKPDRGTYGNGVMRVKTTWISTLPITADDSATGEGTLDQETIDEADKCPSPVANETEVQASPAIDITTYELRYGTDEFIFHSLDELEIALNERIENREYIIQQGIPLMKHDGLPFDLRVLTQKNLQHSWETTGILGRIAAPGKIITNIHGGGRLASFEEVVRPHFNNHEFDQLRSELYRLGIHMAVQLQRSFPRLKEIGIDIALDESGRPWILEVNTLPGIYAFALLPDKQTYRKIRRYAIAYGRLPSKRRKSSRPSHKAQASSAKKRTR
ncbi:YheC/YheD family protein [Paenibacillus sp. QZ-Y1]|uniref:YheC/YheD family protein n=1 Tax=Paenibacillus sp. QZ-Y1 TaxID=3414511 RepID=UPI003F7A836F